MRPRVTIQRTTFMLPLPHAPDRAFVAPQPGSCVPVAVLVILEHFRQRSFRNCGEPTLLFAARERFWLVLKLLRTAPLTCCTLLILTWDYFFVCWHPKSYKKAPKLTRVDQDFWEFRVRRGRLQRTVCPPAALRFFFDGDEEISAKGMVGCIKMDR